MTTARMPPLVSELKGKKIRKSVWFWGNSTRLSNFLHRNLVHEVSDCNKIAVYHYRKIDRFLWLFYDHLSGLIGSTCQTK
jgi:hypothetical protein